MTLDAYTSLLKNPAALTDQYQEDLKGVIQAFPYFQSARAIHLKALKNRGSFKYNNALKVAAAHTTDRSILFDYIHSEVFKQNEISEKIKQNQTYINEIELSSFEDISIKKSVIIDDQLRDQIQETKSVLDPFLFESKAPESLLSSDIEFFVEDPIVDTTKTENNPEKTLQRDKPFECKKDETHSFSEWLKITNFKPIIREENTEQPKPTKNTEKKLDLIDKFLESNPKMPEVDKGARKKNIAKERMLPQETLMTETLARIYLAQKNYKKAIQAYRILSLKYPEKSGFFADQIKRIEILQKHKS